MFFKAALLSTLLPILASASPFPSNLFPRQTIQQPGSCPDTNHPLESQFIIGYNQFCENFVSQASSPHLVYWGKPIVATLDLGTPSGQVAKWVFKIEQTINTNNALPTRIDEYTCKEEFHKFLDSDAAGGLGKAYCVVDGTGGDKKGKEEMAGQGIVSVLGGETTTQSPEGSVVWQMKYKSYRLEE